MKEGSNLYYIIIIAVTVISSIILTYLFKKILNIFIKRSAKSLASDPTNFSFIKNSVGFIIYTSALIFIFNTIPYLNSIGTALFAGAGILAIIVGFASQKAFANIISGVFILIFKPFKITDIIEFKDGQKGVVEEITLRHTMIKDYENRRIIIPNSVISEETIINSNIQDSKIKKHIIFSISYDSNVDKAIKIIQEQAMNHKLCIDNRTKEQIKNKEPQVMVRLFELSDFAVQLKAYVWAKSNDDGFILKCDLQKSVKQEFDKEGIEIPFPYRTIVYKKDLNHV